MSSPPHKEDTRRRVEDHSTQATPDEDSWLVRVLVFALRTFLVFFVAFARAVVIVAGDKIPDTLLNQAIPTAVSSNSVDPQVNTSLGLSETRQDKASFGSAQGYFIIFIGREVGYTTSSTLATSLVTGIPNHRLQRFDTLDEAIKAYTEAVQVGDVRRVRTVIQASGHVEFTYEYLSVAAGIRNLDIPRMAPHPLIPATFPIDSLPPLPGDSEAYASQCGATSVSPVTRSDGLIMPPDCWAVVNTCESSADTVIISPVLQSTSASGTSGTQDARSVVFLDSDDDSSDAVIVANDLAASTHSAHSSDVYYSDKQFDKVIAAYIENEENNETNMGAISIATQTD